MDNIHQYNRLDRNSKVAQSFTYLINSYHNNNKANNNSNDIPRDFNIETHKYFCNDECREKFNKVIEKIKNKEIQLDKIDLSQYTGDDNLIANAMVYYYQLGYYNAFANNQSA